MTSIEPKLARVLIKFLSATCHMLRISKQRKNDKNNAKTAFLWPIFIKPMPSDTLLFTPRLLAQMKELIELHNLGKFPEDSNCSSPF